MHRALGLLGQSFGRLYLAALWPYAFTLAIMLVVRLIMGRYTASQQQYDPTQVWQSMSVAAKLAVVATFIATIWLPAGLAYASVVQAVLQMELSAGDVIKRILRRFVPLALLSVLLGVAITFGQFVFFFPGLVIEAFCAFAIPAMVMEEHGVFSSIGRSFSLASRKFWTVFGTLIGAISLVVVVYLVVAAFIIPLIQPTPTPVSGLRFVLFLAFLLLIIPPLAMEVFGTIFAVLYSKIVGEEQLTLGAAVGL